jgi:epsilon-lactone hydrolase
MASKQSIEERQRLIQHVASQPEGLTIAESRQRFESFMGLIPLEPDIRFEKFMIEEIPAAWVIAPNAAEDRVFLYLHGGAYILGSCNTHKDLAAKLSRSTASRVLLIDYRLAPKNPFPAAIEDAVTAYRWLLSIGVSPERIVVGGDSAGGGLTMSLLLSLRDAGVSLPAAGVLLSPWTDLEGTGESMETRADVDPWINPQETRLAPVLYIGDMDRRHPLVSPIYADLQGMPPLLVHVGSDEILLDDSVRLAENARTAGVEVSINIWEDMWHVFQQFNPPEARQAIEEIGTFVIQKLDQVKTV